MTLSPDQYKKVYDGLPAVLDGINVGKTRTYQYTNRPRFPRLVFMVVTDGIEVSQPSRLASYLNQAESLKITVWRQQFKARIRVIIDSQDRKELQRLAYAFSTWLKTTELGVNPVQDFMQYRGADPPMPLHPVTPPDNAKLVHRSAVDFFVEYTQTWEQAFDVIREVYVEYESQKRESSSSEFFYAAYDSTSNQAEFYSLDAILA